MQLSAVEFCFCRACVFLAHALLSQQHLLLFNNSFMRNNLNCNCVFDEIVRIFVCNR